MTELHSVLMVAVICAVTLLLRFLPFMIFRGERKTPEYVLWLGRVLPYAIMGILVVYCLRNVKITTSPYGLPELIACTAVALLHLWKHNSLLSIGGGTLIYMLLPVIFGF